jgi:hypothetical protein
MRKKGRDEGEIRKQIHPVDVESFRSALANGSN